MKIETCPEPYIYQFTPTFADLLCAYMDYEDVVAKGGSMDDRVFRIEQDSGVTIDVYTQTVGKLKVAMADRMRTTFVELEEANWCKPPCKTSTICSFKAVHGSQGGRIYYDLIHITKTAIIPFDGSNFY